MLPDSAFMTEEGKNAELRSYHDRLLRWEERGCPSEGGVGYPDLEMLPWVVKINRLDGICTLQSCSGHTKNQYDYIMPGGLWLWMSRPKWLAFQEVALDLAMEPTIEKVAVLYQPYGRVIEDIIFEGLGRGTFEDSMSIIYKYLASI